MRIANLGALTINNVFIMNRWLTLALVSSKLLHHTQTYKVDLITQTELHLAQIRNAVTIIQME